MAYTHIHSATPGKILSRKYGIHPYTLRHFFKETYRDFARTKQSFNGRTYARNFPDNRGNRATEGFFVYEKVKKIS